MLLVSAVVSAQKIIKTEKVTDHSTHVVGDDFEGVVFDGGFNARYPTSENDTVKNNKWYTPSISEIELSENVLRSQIKDIDKTAKYPSGNYIFIHLNKYRRQYVGYTNKNGEKVIYMNCFPVDEKFADGKSKLANPELNIPRWYNDMIMTFDGGIAFWQVKINLTTGIIIALYVDNPA